MIVILTVAYLLGFGQDSIQTEALTDARVSYACIVHAQFLILKEKTTGIVPVVHRYAQPIPQYRSTSLLGTGASNLPGDSDYVWSHQRDASQHPP